MFGTLPVIFGFMYFFLQWLTQQAGRKADAITDSTILLFRRGFNNNCHCGAFVKECKISAMASISSTLNMKDGSGSIYLSHQTLLGPLCDLRLVEELIWQLYINNIRQSVQPELGSV